MANTIQTTTNDSFLAGRYAAEAEWSLEGIPVNDPSNDSLLVNEEADDTEWPFANLSIDETVEAAKIESTPLEIQQKILSYIVDQKYRINIDSLTGCGPNSLDFPQEVLRIFKGLDGIWLTNHHLSKIAQDWVLNHATFAGDELNFQDFPKLFGFRRARKIKSLHLDLQVCHYNDGDRLELFETLVKGLSSLETLVLIEWFPSQQSGQIVGARHKAMRDASTIVLCHRKLKRLSIMPDVAKKGGFLTPYLLDTGACKLDRKLFSEDFNVVGGREDVMVLNATKVVRTQPAVLRCRDFEDISILPDPDSTKDDISSSEVPDPGSHYSIIDMLGLRNSDRPASNDQQLFRMCRQVDKAPHPLAYLMKETVKLTRKLEGIELKKRETDTAASVVQSKLNDRNDRLSRINALASQLLDESCEPRQAQDQMSKILDVAQSSDDWLDGYVWRNF